MANKSPATNQPLPNHAVIASNAVLPGATVWAKTRLLFPCDLGLVVDGLIQLDVALLAGSVRS